jgi:hypothetical protein
LVAVVSIWVLAIGFCVPKTSSQAGDFASALSAFDLYSRIQNTPVVGMVGFYGQPDPPQWMVLSPPSEGKEKFRETVVSRGKLAAERTFRKLPGQDLPTLPIDRNRVQIDSREAFSIAEEVAKKKKISFESAHFQLRCRDENTEPVWVLNLINEFQVGVATIYLSAETGTVLRSRFPDVPVEKYSSPANRKSG